MHIHGKERERERHETGFSVGMVQNSERTRKLSTMFFELSFISHVRKNDINLNDVNKKDWGSQNSKVQEANY